jgi:hypothetical protein
MTDHEDRFAASLDALSRGEPPAPNDDLTQFVTEARSTWSNPTDLPPGSPPRLSATDRRHLWTAIQQEAAIKPSASIHEGRHVMSATSPTVQATSNQPTGWGATISRWQPVLSMTVMFVVLAVLVGIAYTGLDHTDDELPAISLAALTDEATPPPIACAPYGPPTLSRDQLRDLSLSDWPAGQYEPVAPADPLVGAEAVAVFEAWNFCSLTSGSAFDPQARRPDEFMRYLSPRAQYVIYLQENPSYAPDELEAAMTIDQEQILSLGTLPVNRPLTMEWDPVNGIGYPSFVPGDLYHLTDGRYGVILGSISTAQLQSLAPGAEVELLPWMTWVAFVEIDGDLYIDEYVSFCATPAAGNSTAGQFTSPDRPQCLPMTGQ